jgi:hypothetical protein
VYSRRVVQGSVDRRPCSRFGSDEHLARQRVLEELPLEEQERIYEIFEAARRRLAGKDIETTAVALSNGNRDPQPDDDRDEAESEG